MATNLSDVESIFYAAIELATPEQCNAYVQNACDGNEQLRERVEKLLQAHFRAGNFLEPSAATLPPDIELPIQEGAGTVIGPYKLLQQIGEGGMGVVFLAEQSRPVRRQVALKIIKPGMDTRQVIARFAAEQQALALMDHPNIARVFDAGTTDGGRPYFVMELVKGVPLTEYCDQQHLTPQQRLELFIPICHALQHAHQKGIIHRDLKPSNVLVAPYDGRPVPKVIDFGVAKATGATLTERTMFTEIGQVVGTLEYMSPEQAVLNQLDVDTRSDIYSLGVLLYELLTGTTPFEKQQLRSAAFDEMLRIIREEDPPKPSTRLSTTEGLPSIAANRSLEPKKLSGVLRGDLDWIVMKALEKDRSRRYETANALSRDLQRYLADEPVEAAPPSRAHRIRKFVRRNKGTAAAVAAVLTALITGIIGTSLGLLQAQRQRAEADHATQQTQQQLAATTLQRALALCEKSDTARGVLWLGRALELAHRVGADDVEQDCRWNLDAWTRQLHQLQLVLPHPEAVLAVALSPDGQTVASGCKDGKVRLWNTATGEMLGEPLVHNSAVRVLAFHPHQPLLLAGCLDGTITLWDLQTRAKRGPILHQDRPVSCVAFSPDGETMLTASFDGMAKLWKTNTGEMLCQPLYHENNWCPGFTRGVIAAFSPDGKSLVTAGGGRGQLKFWDSRTGQAQEERTIECGKLVVSVAWNCMRNSILVALWKGVVAQQKDATTGENVGPRLMHLDNLTSVNYSADGTTMVTGSEDHYVRVWDAATGDLLGVPLQHQMDVESVAISANGQTIVSGSQDATVRIWKRAPGDLIRTLTPNYPTRSAAFSSDGSTVLLGIYSGGLETWNVATGELEKRWFDSSMPDEEVEGVAFSSDDKTIYAMHTNLQVVKRWDRITEKLLGSTPVHGSTIRRMAISPDKTTIITRGDYDSRLWNAATGQPIGSPLQFGDRVLGEAFNPNGQNVLTSCADKTTQNWSTITGKPVGPAIEHSNEISAMAFSPDGRMILAVEDMNVARLCEASSWQPLSVPLEHQGIVRSVGFSPDGSAILTGCGDGQGRLWNAATCRPIGPAWQHYNQINAVTCSPDGKLALTASDDGTAKLWRMPVPLPGKTEEVVSWTKLITGSYLDEQEVVHVLDFDTWLRLERKVLGDEHPLVAFSLHNLALSRSGQEHVEEAADTASPSEKPSGQAKASGSQYALRAHKAAVNQQWDEAAANYVRALDLLDENAIHEQMPLEDVCRELAQWNGVFDRVVQLRPQSSAVWIGRAEYYVLRSQWDQALAAYAKIVHSQNSSFNYPVEYAGLLLLAGNKEEYRQFCQEYVGQHPSLEDGYKDYARAHMCGLGPADGVDPTHMLEWATQATRILDPFTIAVAERQHVLGLAQYRAGQFDQAIESLKKSNDSTWHGVIQAQNWFVLAMIHRRLGREAEARTCFETALQLIQPSELTTPDALLRSYVSRYWIAVHVLAREAEVLLADPTSLGNVSRSGTTELVAPRAQAAKYVKLVHVATGRVLATEDDSADAEAQMILTKDEDNKARQWIFEQDGDDFKVVNRQSGKVLDVFQNSMDNGSLIIQYDSKPNDNDNQYWSWIGKEEGAEKARRLKSKSSGLVLDVNDQGNVIQRHFEEKAKTQLWQVIEVPEGEKP